MTLWICNIAHSYKMFTGYNKECFVLSYLILPNKTEY